MNVGDLITLSSRGKKLEACWRWTRQHHGIKGAMPRELVGLIIAIKDPPNPRYDKEKKYYVKWIGDGPKSRTTWGYGYNTGSLSGVGFWHRSDLKFVAKAKK